MMTLTDTPTDTPEVVRQLRQARRLADHLSAASYPDPGLALDVAGGLPAEGWSTLARNAGLDTDPSPATAALALELVRERADQHRLSPDEHYAQAETCLRQAAVARAGSPKQDAYLRRALIHAMLAPSSARPAGPAGGASSDG